VTWRRLLVASLVALVARPAAGGPYDPLLQFRTLRTPHFEIHYHHGEEEAAARLALIAERVFDHLTRQLAHSPAGRTHVVLVHQNDQPNGFTEIVPWNAIEIDAVPPTGAEQLGNTDDWLTYVFTHEFAHVLHLDRSRGWARVVRGMFGRTEIGFPNLSLPEWQIEGFATLFESESGMGRLHGGDFREVVDAGARAGRMEPLDRLNGGLVDWPSSTGWYAYGARFHEYLATTYGAGRLAALADRTSGRLPYLTSGAFKGIYRKSLGELWREFEAAAMLSSASPAATLPSASAVAVRPEPVEGRTPRRLTALGFHVTTPRVDGDGTIWFSASNPHGFPGLYRVVAGKRPERVAERYGGTGLTLGRDAVIFDQLEFVRGAGLASDLYALRRRNGRVRRLTREARLVDPDLSPDGRWLAVIRTRPGARELLVLDATKLLEAATPIGAASLPIVSRLGDEFEVFAGPRWSPDGTRLAVERRALHGRSEILVLNADLSPAGAPISSPSGRNVTPEWSADGKTIVFASDRDGGPFALYEVSPSGPDASIVRIATPAGGATGPARTPDGHLVFVGYTVAGYDVFELDTVGPIGVAPAVRQGQPEHDVETSRSASPGASTLAAASPYRPWSTFAPRGWLPVIEQRDDRWRLGGAVTATDVLGRHVAAAAASWAVTNGPDASSLVPQSRPDWSASYAYSRWQLVPFTALSDETSLFDGVDQKGHVVPLAEREQQVVGGLYRAFRRVRWAQAVLGEARIDRITQEIPDASDTVDRRAFGAAWTIDTSREYGYSISPEHGILAGVTAERFSQTGADARDAHDFTADFRAYVPLPFRHAVLAVRGAGGVSAGTAGVRRIFRLGGNDGDPAPGTFGDDTMSLLRGFEHGEFAGTHVALANIEARIPLGWPERGWGTWPLFLRSLHATAFVDVGNAWRQTVSWQETKLGAGAELSTGVVALFGLPLTWTGGVAWGHDGAGSVPDQRTVYFRVGPSF
jgi:hypothetical protein